MQLWQPARPFYPQRAWRRPQSPAGGGGSQSDIQFYTSSTTWNKPVGAEWVRVTVIGGGGGGGCRPGQRLFRPWRLGWRWRWF